MIGVQPSLPVPPLSTIYGLLSAIAGFPITPYEVSIAYIFESETNFFDLELIYEIEKLTKTKSNIIKRENLFNCNLFLYLNFLNIDPLDFKKPKYPLLLGRSTDLASIVEISRVNLERKKNVPLGKTIITYSPSLKKGLIQALPTYMTQEIPRKAIGVQPFILLDTWQEYPEEIWYDPEKDVGLWLHDSKTLGLKE